jgi:hypothetical protein
MSRTSLFLACATYHTDIGVSSGFRRRIWLFWTVPAAKEPDWFLLLVTRGLVKSGVSLSRSRTLSYQTRTSGRYSHAVSFRRTMSRPSTSPQNPKCCRSTVQSETCSPKRILKKNTVDAAMRVGSGLRHKVRPFRNNRDWLWFHSVDYGVFALASRVVSYSQRTNGSTISRLPGLPIERIIVLRLY